MEGVDLPWSVVPTRDSVLHVNFFKAAKIEIQDRPFHLRTKFIVDCLDLH